MMREVNMLVIGYRTGNFYFEKKQKKMRHDCYLKKCGTIALQSASKLAQYSSETHSGSW